MAWFTMEDFETNSDEMPLRRVVAELEGARYEECWATLPLLKPAATCATCFGAPGSAASDEDGFE
jgi:hypothetical protein